MNPLIERICGYYRLKEIPLTDMSRKKTYTFKCSDTIQAAVTEIMDTWQLDRTSVIKLALFHLYAYLQKEEVKSLSLYELIEEMERQTPPAFPSYAAFDNN